MYAEGMSEWITAQRNGATYTEHRGGTPWYDAQAPRRRHRCTPQTRAMSPSGYIERCACWAVRVDGGDWAAPYSQRVRPSKAAEFLAAYRRRINDWYAARTGAR